MNGLTPRKAVFDALQRCPSGLTRRGLAQIAYGSQSENDADNIDQIIWRLRDHARIDAVRVPGQRAAVYRLMGVL